jgi:hypothetical protein
MCHDNPRPLTFEGLLSDPLTRMVMDADGVTVDEFTALMHAARDAMVARGRPIPMRAAAMRLAMCAPA